MPESVWFDLLLFAAKGAAAPAKAEDGGLLSMIYLLPIVLVVFYFMVLRPQTSGDKARRERLSKIKKNDKVVTTAGIYGTVVQVDQEAKKIVLKVDDERGVRMTFRMESVLEVTDPSSEKEKEKAASSTS